jgi:hypothetical protein
LIHRAFIDKYYSNDEKNKELYKELENKEGVLVTFPDIIKLTQDICEAMSNCVAVIRDNPVYRSVLENKTTFYDYWFDTSTTLQSDKGG